MMKYTLCTSRYTHDEGKIECKRAKEKDLVSFVSALRRGAPLEAQDSKGRSPGQVFNLESIRRDILTVLWNISKCMERCYRSVYKQVISKIHQSHFASWKIVSFFIISTDNLYCENIYTVANIRSPHENKTLPVSTTGRRRPLLTTVNHWERFVYVWGLFLRYTVLYFYTVALTVITTCTVMLIIFDAQQKYYFLYILYKTTVMTLISNKYDKIYVMHVKIHAWWGKNTM